MLLCTRDGSAGPKGLVLYSLASGKNPGPCFDAWGVPTSETARKSIAELPGWMPADWPKL